MSKPNTNGYYLMHLKDANGYFKLVIKVEDDFYYHIKWIESSEYYKGYAKTPITICTPLGYIRDGRNSNEQVTFTKLSSLGQALF